MEKYLEVTGDNYKNNDNYHYYFIRSMLNKCVDGYNDILQYFFDYIAYRSLDPSTNFSVLRYNINNEFFKKIINDDDFKLLFYNTLDNFETPSIPKLSQ